MIGKIGIIYQDRNSREFLLGLRDRLNCEAELIDPPAAIGITRDLPRRQANRAWAFFQKAGVDLVIRLTDSDGARWQEVRREELGRVPEVARSVWICGVAVNNLEDWLSGDPAHLARVLDASASEIQNISNRTGVVKRLISKKRSSREDSSDCVARIVRDAPSDVFRQWLNSNSLRQFYADCRAAASCAGCETANELDEA